MPTYTDLLPPSKTSPNRALKYTPACAGVGVLELTDSRTHVRYALARQPFGGFRLTKADGSENYVVTAGACECKGFVFGRGKLCKHIEAVHTLLANRWLEGDDRETVRDLHAEAEEMDQWYDRGPDRMDDDAHADALGRAVYAERGGC